MRTTAFVALLASAVVAVIVAYQPSRAGSQTTRTLAGWCNPSSPFHQLLGGHTGDGGGYITCDTDRVFNYTARLYNASGNVLAERSAQDGPWTTAEEFSPTVGCAGAYVHGFIYVNYNGVGQSNTEQSADLC